MGYGKYGKVIAQAQFSEPLATEAAEYIIAHNAAIEEAAARSELSPQAARHYFSRHRNAPELAGIITQARKISKIRKIEGEIIVLFSGANANDRGKEQEITRIKG